MNQSEIVEQFMALYKSAQGKSLELLILEIIGHKNLFKFTDFIGLEKFKELKGKGGSGAKYMKLFEVFSTGTMSDYQKNAQNLPKIKAKHIKKLQKLTILSLAEKSRTLEFADIAEACDLSSEDEIEEMLIECIMEGVIQGDISHLHKNINIRYSRARDLAPGEDKILLAKLRALISKAEVARNHLNSELRKINKVVKESNKRE